MHDWLLRAFLNKLIITDIVSVLKDNIIETNLVFQMILQQFLNNFCNWGMHDSYRHSWRSWESFNQSQCQVFILKSLYATQVPVLSMWFLQARCGLRFTIFNHNHWEKCLRLHEQDDPLLPNGSTAIPRFTFAIDACVFFLNRNSLRTLRLLH